MEALKELKKNLEKQIEEINKKNDISPTELDRLDKAVDIIKDIETICAMKEYNYQEEAEDYNYSNRYPMYMRDGGMGGVSRTGGYSGNRYYMDRGYDPMMDNSYRRGREPMNGRYMSREMPYRSYDDGYSGHANKEDLKMDLRMMMDKAGSDKERMAIQQLLEQWKD